MIVIGYARQGEDIPGDDARQETALRAAGCEAVFVEDDGGEGTGVERAAWKATLERMGVGDTLVVRRLDHLGESWAEVVDNVRRLAEKGAQFVSLNDGIDTRAVGGEVVFAVFAALANVGRGSSVVRARGRSGGRRPPAPEMVAELKRLAKDVARSPAEICKTLGISKATYYRYLGR